MSNLKSLHKRVITPAGYQIPLRYDLKGLRYYRRQKSEDRGRAKDLNFWILINAFFVFIIFMFFKFTSN